MLRCAAVLLMHLSHTRAMHNMHTHTGEQLRNELLSIPLGMLLLFSRINEQLG